MSVVSHNILDELGNEPRGPVTNVVTQIIFPTNLPVDTEQWPLDPSR